MLTFIEVGKTYKLRNGQRVKTVKSRGTPGSGGNYIVTYENLDVIGSTWEVYGDDGDSNIKRTGTAREGGQQSPKDIVELFYYNEPVQLDLFGDWYGSDKT